MSTAPDSYDQAAARTGRPVLEGFVSRDGAGNDVYTLAPQDASGMDLMTRWISVSSSDVLDVEQMR